MGIKTITIKANSTKLVHEAWGLGIELAKKFSFIMAQIISITI